MANKAILKEVQQTCYKSFSNGQIAVSFPDESDLTKVDVKLTPMEGLYEGGTFHFEVILPHDYPHSTAGITCKTLILHPNINYDGYICFNLLNDEWNPEVRLLDYAHGLLWLLYQPNLDSRLNGDVPSDYAQFKRLVLESLHGRTLFGRTFPRMLTSTLEPSATSSASSPFSTPLTPIPAPNTPPTLRLPAPFLLNRDPHRFNQFARRVVDVRPPADTPAPATTPTRPPARRWPPVTGAVRFAAGVRAY